ncbi:MAG TPA: M23 family metallopeptidase [Micromonosporaceae bacterium]
MSQAATALVTARPVRRTFKRLAIATASVLLIGLLCLGAVTLSLLGGLTGDDLPTYALGCGNGVPVDPNGTLPRVAELTEEQVRNAAVIVSVGQNMQVVPRGWVIGVATALQESRLTNLPHLGADNDHDSIGLFQQRPSQGWGTVDQLSDPAYQARRFFEKLLRISNWQAMPLTVAAQKVQVSAYPNAYAKHEPLAAKVVDLLTGGASRAAGSVLALRCAAAGEIAASGWTVPVKGNLTSGFRTADRPGHNGVDIAVAKGTPVRAAAAGLVLTAMCNAHIGEQAYSCDRDGGVFVQGCGWYVEILHAGNVITRYCHLSARPYLTEGEYVAAGQVIGVSGSSGNSSGPHLHFEIHLDGDTTGRGAVDPVPYMNQVGAPLVGSA